MASGMLIYDSMIYVFALSLLFVFSDGIRRNANAKRTGTGLLVVVLVLQLAYMGIRTWNEGHLPIFVTYDFLFLFSVILVLISLILTRYQRSEFAVLLLNIISFAVLVLNNIWMEPLDNPLGNWHTVHGLLLIHIALANLGFVAMTVAAVFSGLYLFLHRKLKVKKWNDTIRRLPSLEMMDRYTHMALLIGTPLLGVSIVVAVISIIAEERWLLLLDTKVLMTAIALCVYIIFLVSKRLNQRSGLVMAKWALVGYTLLILNFLLNSWSVFHQWTGE
ncbi:cytochrome c biogenesis protein CcsA [Paenibacillus sp. FSL M8-0228]|uniref:Cytochrome c biogenesis protein CcsA n=1 Tax=Paenibacillus polymyxa TaxID=1406 RepID=A0A8I1LQZ8_PAEPO|nr:MULTISPECIES: cytochrome c biogenesis protein CcsA [Paenibacillus]KAF6573065.1 cytochrome c biogenesis protein CcsA [Paenibacillus sp. EKM206P]KAF6587472.1 cytochrome c biogenesis protein CcsA [Paenibacillus sp. EKM205P]KEO77813.1 ABC transporter permease [Paenibacillus polymyxa]MBM0633655.1 cytochrome c biogenesis protein CcsA [Paenibacillus polymyxa]MBO3285891.1 cytochrome c biogenesis protein CcsA [Paenibacillus polymyxa]